MRGERSWVGTHYELSHVVLLLPKLTAGLDPFVKFTIAESERAAVKSKYFCSLDSCIFLNKKNCKMCIHFIWLFTLVRGSIFL